MALDVSLLDATSQAELIRTRQISSRELLEVFEKRLEMINPAINAVCTLDLERARRRCIEADEATARGEVWGLLHGLPITVKDAIATSGIRSTGGSTLLGDHVPVADAPAVASLRAAGAIVFGKTNLPEWSDDIQTYNEMFGTTENPWRTGLTPGGSSGGAAAAVSCGVTAFELGTDIGGSVRIPSAFCGIWGHKPSYGVIPTLGYLDAVGGGTTEADVNCFGPMARSAQDLSMLLGILGGPRPDRAAAWQLDLPPPPASLRGLRVAAWLDDPLLPVEDAVAPLFEAAAAALEDAGALVDRTARPNLDLDSEWRNGTSLIGVATSPSMTDDQFARAVEFSLDPELAFRAGRVAVRHREWLAMDRQRTAARARWAEFFESWDVLLCPVTMTAAFPHLQEGSFTTRQIEVNGQSRAYLELCAWAGLIGSAYLPSTVPPIGRTADGRPVGIQVVSPYLHDRRSIAVAGWLGELVGGYEPPPIAR
jgi:amidase